MLIEGAVGDAYAIAWEFAPFQKGANDLETYHQNPKYPEFPAAHYSDDTMRSIANCAIVLGDRARWFDPNAYAEQYQRIHAADGRLGWSKGFQAYLESSRDMRPQEFVRNLRRRATNGALMGVAPLGYLPDERDIRLATAAQVMSTHSGAAISSAQVVSLSSHYLINDKGPIRDLPAYLEAEVDWADKEERTRILCQNGGAMPRASMPAWTIAAGAVFILTDEGFSGLADRLRWIVDLATRSEVDADSLAAVTMALCSCSREISQDLPMKLVDGLESDEVRSNLRAIDASLRRFSGT